MNIPAIVSQDLLRYPWQQQNHKSYALSPDDLQKIKESLQELSQGKEPEIKTSGDWSAPTLILSGLALIALTKFIAKLAEDAASDFWAHVKGEKLKERESSDLQQSSAEFSHFRALIEGVLNTVSDVLVAKTDCNWVVRFNFTFNSHTSTLELVASPLPVDRIAQQMAIDLALKHFCFSALFHDREDYNRQLREQLANIAVWKK